LKANLKREGLAMRLFGPLLLAKALTMAYRSDEVETIVERTSFAGGCRIENVALVGLPIWMHIQLTKGGALGVDRAAQPAHAADPLRFAPCAAEAHR
jgi:hypothetical protein